MVVSSLVRVHARWLVVWWSADGGGRDRAGGVVGPVGRAASDSAPPTADGIGIRAWPLRFQVP